MYLYPFPILVVFASFGKHQNDSTYMYLYLFMILVVFSFLKTLELQYMHVSTPLSDFQWCFLLFREELHKAWNTILVYARICTPLRF